LRILILLYVAVILTSFGCHEKTVGPNDAEGILSAEDVGVTDAWLNIHLPHPRQQYTITVKRDTSTILHTVLTTQDTLIADEGLLPKHTYLYTLIQDAGLLIKPETQLTITTMDTTSHDFTWTIDTLGDGNSSVSYDVAIINDTLAYAVGEINVKDSLGNWINPPYNMAIWNGIEWKLKTIMYNYQGVDYYAALHSTFALGKDDYWVGSNQPMHWNGSNWITYDLSSSIWNGWINKIWGTSSSNIYIVGDNGNIAHYNGTSWEKMESGTSLMLADIYGTSETITIGGLNMSTVKSIVLRKDDTNWSTIAEGEIVSPSELFNPKIYGLISSVWIDEHKTLYAGGNLLYKYQFDKWSYVSSLPENYIGGNPNVYYRGYIYKIRGLKSNDYWIVGDRNTIRHFNGMSWRQVGLPYDPYSDIIWQSVEVKGKICIVVGEINEKAICMRMTK
jgi:hypothetical protein